MALGLSLPPSTGGWSLSSPSRCSKPVPFPTISFLVTGPLHLRCVWGEGKVVDVPPRRPLPDRASLPQLSGGWHGRRLRAAHLRTCPPWLSPGWPAPPLGRQPWPVSDGHTGTKGFRWSKRVLLCAHPGAQGQAAASLQLIPHPCLAFATPRPAPSLPSSSLNCLLGKLAQEQGRPENGGRLPHPGLRASFLPQFPSGIKFPPPGLLERSPISTLSLPPISPDFGPVLVKSSPS